MHSEEKRQKGKQIVSVSEKIKKDALEGGMLRCTLKDMELCCDC